MLIHSFIKHGKNEPCSYACENPARKTKWSRPYGADGLMFPKYYAAHLWIT